MDLPILPPLPLLPSVQIVFSRHRREARTLCASAKKVRQNEPAPILPRSRCTNRGKYSTWEGPSRAATGVARIRSVSRASQDRRYSKKRGPRLLTINGEPPQKNFCRLGAWINNAHRTTLLATEGKLSPCMIGRIRWASWSVRSIRPRPLALRLASRTALNANRSTILTISTITSRIVVHLLPTARHCPSRRRCVKQLFFKKMFRGKRDLRLLKPLFRAATARSVRRLPRKLGAS